MNSMVHTLKEHLIPLSRSRHQNGVSLSSHDMATMVGMSTISIISTSEVVRTSFIYLSSYLLSFRFFCFNFKSFFSYYFAY